MIFPSPDRDLLRTVLFSVAVVLTVIGIYQTILQNDLIGNYWLFMIAIACLLVFRRLKPAESPVPKGPAGKKPAGARPKQKPRGPRR